MYRPSIQTENLKKVRSLWSDLFLLAVFFLFIYFFIALTRHWISPLQTEVNIDLSLSALPRYSFYSLIRALIAYFCSLVFTLIFGYMAAKNQHAERVILPLLDIGQSIPVVGFMPGLVLALIALFPERNFGLELACILMIFTGQVWNMTFSYYASLKAVPQQFHELGQVLRMPWSKKLFHIELPYSFTNLVWNSLMSMAGGWFFLTLCESFPLQDKHFTLPGLGSYMNLAIDKGDQQAIVFGILSMIFIIVAMDFLFWRPILAWSQKFRLEDAQDQTKDIPFVMILLKESSIVQWIFNFFERDLMPSRLGHPDLPGELKPIQNELKINTEKKISLWSQFSKYIPDAVIEKLPHLIIVFLLLVGSIYVYELVRPLKLEHWKLIFLGTLATTARVFTAILIASLWAVPAGIMIGSSPKLTRFFQPFIQIAASFPAPMIYPFAFWIFTKLHLELNIGSIFLMLLGVQWYVLFNVLAGANTISLELRDCTNLMGISRWSKWTKLYLPSVFPTLVTGWVTSAGGAWNASVVSEIFTYKSQTYTTLGVGAIVSQASAQGDFSMLTAGLIVMCGTVILLNRSIWRKLYELAENRFRYDR